MPRTIYLSVRGDGAWRVLEAFRRALGEEASTLVVHPNRDESGFYGSADVSDPAVAHEAFTKARQPYPALRAHLSAPPPESEEAPRRTAQPAPASRAPQRSPVSGERPPRQERHEGHGERQEQHGQRGQGRRTARRQRRSGR